MSPRWTRWLLLCVLLFTFVHFTDSLCTMPIPYRGDWYSMESTDHGDDLNSIINADGVNNEVFNGVCDDIWIDNSTRDAQGNFDSKILLYSSQARCYKCYEMDFKTLNIIQYRTSTCVSSGNLQQVCGQIPAQQGLITLFKKTLANVNCKSTFEGVYHFTYEVNQGGGGICDSQRSLVIACQEPGSPYVDNQVFDMRYGKCADVTTSSSQKIRFQCMGSWRDEIGNIFSAVANLGKEIWRERFRCLLTRDDQQRIDNKRRFTISRWATCSSLKSPYEGDERLVLGPAFLDDKSYFAYGNQLMNPGCNLPRNFSGTWFHTWEYDTDVYINATHLYFKTKIDQFLYKETYYTCMMSRDSRYLMTSVTVGECEVDYVCFNFLPRHHNIIRWRMGKPYRLNPSEKAHPDFMHKKFRQACTWSSFTIDRNKVDWTYKLFLLNPPAPIDCPIAGRYKFVQKGHQEEKYTTRIRGITERPRHQIDCREQVSEFKVCHTNTKKIFVDAEYCATLDHTGRPIGEYDEPDRALNCVGYWMEDMKSYLITFDEEDAVSHYRCWVYERLDWRNIVVSRSTRAMCGVHQHARSYQPSEGASLSLELFENERLFDDCPQRFVDGSNPYEEPVIHVLSSSPALDASLLLSMLSTLIMWTQH